jgi:hypothetical protein
MPYEPHANLIQPEDNNAYIWRFIDLPKFLDMLVTGSLYFTRGDMFEDPYEGMPPDEYMEAVRRGGTNIGSVQHQTRMFHHYRADFFINCWHMSDHESAGMWKLYAGVDAGIAIKSTYSRLLHAFKDTPERFYLGLTSYDHNHVFGPTNPFKFSSYKRPAFGHEREVRAMIWRTSDRGFQPIEDVDSPVQWPLPVRPGEKGIHLATSLSQLITEVVLSPSTPPWFPAILRDVIGKYGYSFQVRQSTLNKLSYVS